MGVHVHVEVSCVLREEWFYRLTAHVDVPTLHLHYDVIIHYLRGQGNANFPCSADHEQDWQPYLTRLILTLAICVTIYYSVVPSNRLDRSFVCFPSNSSSSEPIDVRGYKCNLLQRRPPRLCGLTLVTLV